MFKKEEAWWGWAHWVTPVSSVHYVCWRYCLRVAGSGWSPGGALKLVQKVWRELQMEGQWYRKGFFFLSETGPLHYWRCCSYVRRGYKTLLGMQIPPKRKGIPEKFLQWLQCSPDQQLCLEGPEVSLQVHSWRSLHCHRRIHPYGLL